MCYIGENKWKTDLRARKKELWGENKYKVVVRAGKKRTMNFRTLHLRRNGENGVPLNLPRGLECWCSIGRFILTIAANTCEWLFFAYLKSGSIFEVCVLYDDILRFFCDKIVLVGMTWTLVQLVAYFLHSVSK